MYFDRVKDTTTTTGTGNITVSGSAPTGYRTLSAVYAVGDAIPYVIAAQSGTEWEAGIGTYASSNTLERTTVTASSNSGSAVNFSAGTKDVFVDFHAAQAVGLTGLMLANARHMGLP